MTLPRFIFSFAAASTGFIAAAFAAQPSAAITFARGEKVALVGGSFGDVLAQEGTLEALWHSRFPQGEVVVRNFCRPADAVDARQRPGNYTALDDPFAVFRPDTVLCFFGYNEAFGGEVGVVKFKAEYAKTLDGYAKSYAPKGRALKFALVSPAAFEAASGGHLPDGKKENANLALYAKAVAEVARERGLPFVDVFEETNRLFSKDAGLQFTSDGARLSTSGTREVAAMVDRAMFGTTNPAKSGASFEKLRAACSDKAWVHAQDYRMLNGWYVYGGRRTHDKETFPKEYAKIRNMVAVRDRYVWDIAQGKAVPAKPDDSKTGELFVPKTMFGTQPKKEPKDMKYPTPEESIATMKVPAGMEVQLIASETATTVTLKVAGGLTQQINKADIKKRESLKVSSMPEGLANTMSPDEFLDLIEFLSPTKRP